MANDQRIDSLIDIPAVKKEFDQVMEMLDQLGITIKKSNANPNTNFTDSIKQQKESIKQLAEEEAKLTQAEKNLEDQMEKTVQAAKAIIT